MKSQTRAWLMFAVLFIFWGTLPASPFKYFAGMIREMGGYLVEAPPVSPLFRSVALYLLAAVLFLTLLLLGRGRSRLYLAGFCALATIIHHVFLCIRTGQVYPVSFAIAIGLALALLFLLIKSKRPGLWLSDAFIMALPVWLIYDGLVYALNRLPGQPLDRLSPLLSVPDNSLLTGLDGALGLPLAAWAVLPLILALLPMILLAPGRQKG